MTTRRKGGQLCIYTPDTILYLGCGRWELNGTQVVGGVYRGGKKGMFALETCPQRRRILREIKYLMWPVIRYNKVRYIYR